MFTSVVCRDVLGVELCSVSAWAPN